MRSAVFSVLLITVLGAMSGCDTHANDGSSISSVTAPSLPSLPSTTPTAASSLPAAITPACRLLSDADIQSVLGAKVQPSGHKNLSSGASKLPMYWDLCSWQQPSVSEIKLVQLEVFTTKSEQDAIAEYDALVELIREHSPPTAVPEPVPGLGKRSALLPSWLIAQSGREVINVTYTLKSRDEPVDPQVLRRLAEAAAKRLHWR